MESTQQVRERLGELFTTQTLAVLSTQQAGQPYSNLVAFYATDDLQCIYFVTPKTTRKYANILANNRVAFMVNSSTNQASDFHRAISATAVGKADNVTGPEKEHILGLYLAKHPQPLQHLFVIHQMVEH